MMTVLTTDFDSSTYLPPKVVEVPRDVIRTFQHSKKVGNYLLGRTLGEGSFAKVKEALHIPTGEKVAIKVVDKRRAKEDSYVRKNLRREGKLLQQIRHPNVVQLYEVMETENSYYIVTELCKGGDLMDYICQRKKLDEREVKRYIRQIVSAIDYLHRMGIIHRDLKIENLLLDENKDIKLIDFGLGNNIRVAETKDGIRAQELLITQCGSPAYAAPELLGRKKYGPQVDIWSIGVNMYAMLTGTLPFTVDPFNIKVLYNKMISGQMNPLPDNISRDCRDLLRKFLVAEPERRITLSEAMRHPWIAESKMKPMEPSPCPNKLRSDDLIENILKYMSDIQGFRMSEVIRFVTSNTPGAALTMYQILHRKLHSYMADLRVKGKIPALEAQILETRNSANNAYQKKWQTYKQRIVALGSSAKHKISVDFKHPAKHPSHKIENDVTITDIDDNGNQETTKNKSQQPRNPSVNNTETSKSKPNASCLQNKPVSPQRRQSFPKACVITKETTHVSLKRPQNSSIKTANAFQCQSKDEENIVGNKVPSQSPAKGCLFSPRKVRPSARPNMCTADKARENSETNAKVTEQSLTSRPKFQKVLSQVQSTNTTLIDLSKTSDGKLMNQKRLISLACPPDKKHGQRTLSLSSATSDHEPSLERKAETEHSERCCSTKKATEAFMDLAEVERISPLSCFSNNPSSRATSKSEKSLTRADTTVTLPCISPVPQTRNN